MGGCHKALPAGGTSEAALRGQGRSRHGVHIHRRRERATRRGRPGDIPVRASGGRSQGGGGSATGIHGMGIARTHKGFRVTAVSKVNIRTDVVFFCPIYRCICRVPRYVCMYVCIYVCMYVHMHSCVYTVIILAHFIPILIVGVGKRGEY